MIATTTTTIPSSLPNWTVAIVSYMASPRPNQIDSNPPSTLYSATRLATHTGKPLHITCSPPLPLAPNRTADFLSIQFNSINFYFIMEQYEKTKY